ncbi:MAG TPA: hypothetical protein VHH73_07225 [Verrucomicrobiae bacterium]|nr:hypothetical protein [Verrucomicrobiae bacterium]
MEPATSNGFRVWIQERVGGWTVGFEGWHDEFANPEVASRCFFFGFSPACRLRVFRRGSFDYKWQVLHRSEGNWLVESETSSLVFPFWRRPKTRELANNLSGLMS